MKRVACAWLAVSVAQGLCFGQEDNTPPVIEAVAWEVACYTGGPVFFFFPDPGANPLFFGRQPYVPFDPLFETAHELDLLRATITVFDPDFSDDGGDGVYFTFNLFWVPIGVYFAPEPPPVPEQTDAFVPEEGDGLRPPAGTRLVFRIVFSIPEFGGQNQAKLRELLDFDVRWDFLLAVSNANTCEVHPILYLEDCDDPVSFWVQPIFAAENDVLGPPNAQAFADAGADQIVVVGATVTLDGSRTFDSFNVGFDVGNPNIFEKDDVTFTWEWLSGPVRVDPQQNAPTDPRATVTLDIPNDPGNPDDAYVYRLIADDGVNAEPTSDTVKIRVVEQQAVNRPPIAVIRGPARPVAQGAGITLDGSESVDPDGDTLIFRWRQTNELGESIAQEDLREVFQPLGGLNGETVKWQANAVGTFFFRLLVNDGEFQSNATFSVDVFDPVAAGAARQSAPTPNVDSPQGIDLPGSQADSGTSDTDDAVAAPAAPALCGAGFAQAAALLLALGFIRRAPR